MEQESTEAAEHSSPHPVGRPGMGDPPTWSSRPFSGAPSTAFAVAAPSGLTSSGQNHVETPPPSLPISSGPDVLNGYCSPLPILDDYLAYYEHHSLVMIY